MGNINKLNSLPSFMMAGMPRTATTFLYFTLQQHPAVYLPFRKEVNFFTVNYDKGLDWYNGLYKDMADDEVGCDISPLYFMDDNSIERIKKLKAFKIILSIRDPVEWVLSFYAQFKSFDPSVQEFKNFIEGHDYQFGKKKLHLEFKNNKVPRTVEAFKKAFGDNLLIYNYSFFKKNPLKVLQTIESFVGIQPYFNESNFENIKINASNRTNIKFISYILSRESFISFLHSALPRRLVLFSRNIFDSFSAQPKDSAYVHLPENIQLAEENFADQRKAILELFSEHNIILGSGRPFYSGK